MAVKFSCKAGSFDFQSSLTLLIFLLLYAGSLLPNDRLHKTIYTLASDIDLDSWRRTDGMYAMAGAPSIERTPVSLRAYPDSRQMSEVCCKLKSVTKK
jgi:hypothetical protein